MIGFSSALESNLCYNVFPFVPRLCGRRESAKTLRLTIQKVHPTLNPQRFIPLSK